MSPGAIHQFVPMLHRGDAVGRHTLRLRDLMVARGFDSRIYVELTDPDTAGETETASAYEERSQPVDVLLYQFATGSQLAGWLQSRRQKLVVNYHNVTPPEFFAPWDNPVARLQLQAQSELALLGPRAALGIAVSAYNEAELRAAGYRTTTVVPPAAMLPTSATPPPGPPPESRTGDGARWLMVGRLAPNKAIQHALAALLVARAHHDPKATLEIVGHSVIPSYTDALRRYAAQLGLHDCVTFRGHVSDDALEASMARADVLVVTSQHEGFGVPILEALSHGLPVVANRSGALPEVLGQAGVLVAASDPYELAAAVSGLLSDPDRCRAQRSAGQAQLAVLDLDSAGDRLIDQVCALG